MRQATIIALVLAAAAPALTGQSDTTWAPTRKKAFQYADSSGLWRVVGGLPLDEAIRTYEQAVRTDNPYLNAARFWPGYQIMLDEPGDWYVFGVGMRPGYSLLLSAESTVTLVDKSG